jgi:lipoyl(octanoyl) transferase
MEERAAAYLYDLLARPVPYAEAVALQADLAAARSQGAIPDTIVLLEHPPTLTLGSRTREADELPLGRTGYEALGWEVVRTDRGGRSTWHGPGQLVAYPILDLRAHGRDLRRYVHDLEAAVVAALGDLGVEAHARPEPEHVGVWVGDAERPRKICSLGIRADRWIVRHGLALNVDPDLDAFARFDACGLPGLEVTSVARELRRPVTVAEAAGPLVDRLGDALGLSLEPVPVGSAA